MRVHRRKLAWGRGPGVEVHAAAYPRTRRLVLDTELLAKPSELGRILIHELFHFVWLRLSNAVRLRWESLLAGEHHQHARGELGWSSAWRKKQLRETDISLRSRRWHEYVCESFCDTAAWRYCGVKRHDEFELAKRHRGSRERFFDEFTRHYPGGFRI